MKKRKILLLIPFAGLVLSGCTFQEGWQTTTSWLNNNIWTPVKTFFENLFNGGGNKGGGGKPTPGPDTPETEHEGTLADPLSAEDAIAIGESLEEGKYSAKEYYVRGEVQSASYGGDQYGNYNITIESGFEGFHMKYGPNRANFSNGDVNSGDIVLMFGKIKNYSGKYELDGNLSGGAYVVSIDKNATLESISIEGTPKTEYVVGENYGHTGLTVEAKFEGNVTQDVTNFVTWTYSKAKAEANDSQVTITASYKGKSDSIQVAVNVSSGHAGTEDDPLIAAEANSIASGLASGSYSDQAYYIKGVVQSIEESPGETYKNYTFNIEEGFKGYRMKKENNGDFAPGEIEVGYTVLMYGKIKNFNGTYELDGTKNGGAYVVSVIAEVVEVESVTLSQNEIAMEVDDLVTLEAYVHPSEANQKVNWTVEQEGDIISFNKDTGVITGLAVGTATITATSVENAQAFASATVTVSEKTKILTDIEINTSNVKVSYNVGEQYSYDGIVVTAKYSNADDQDVTAAATVSMDKSVVSDQDEELTLTVSYGEIEKQVVLAIQVSDKTSLQLAYEGAIAAETGEFTFQGTVVSITGNSYVLQDGAYAINIYNKATEGVELGKLVQVVSTLKLYNGCPQTNTISSAAVVGEGTPQTSALVGSKADLDALNHNVLAHVDDAVFVSDNGDWASGATKQFVFTIGNDNITISFDKQGYDSAKAAIANAAVVGDHFAFTGLITAAYSNTNQFTFTGTSGITKTGDAPVADPESVTITSGSSVAVGSSLTLSATVSPANAPQDVEWSITSGSNFATLTNGVLTGQADGDVVVRATAVGHESVYDEKTIKVSSSVVQQSYKLVTDTSTLAANDHIIITNADKTYGLGAYAGGNNCPAKAVTDTNGVLTSVGDAAELILESSGTAGKFYIKIGTQYLYAAASGSNHLKAKDSTDAENGVWEFTYSGGVMGIVAYGSSNRNVMRYNPNNGNPIFSCYGSTSTTGTLMQVYKLS